MAESERSRHCTHSDECERPVARTRSIFRPRARGAHDRRRCAAARIDEHAAGSRITRIPTASRASGGPRFPRILRWRTATDRRALARFDARAAGRDTGAETVRRERAGLAREDEASAFRAWRKDWRAEGDRACTRRASADASDSRDPCRASFSAAGQRGRDARSRGRHRRASCRATRTCRVVFQRGRAPQERAAGAMRPGSLHRARDLQGEAALESLPSRQMGSGA